MKLLTLLMASRLSTTFLQKNITELMLELRVTKEKAHKNRLSNTETESVVSKLETGRISNAKRPRP